MNWINEIGKVAASLTAIIGLLMLVFFNPIRKYIAARKKEREEEKEFREMAKKTLMSIRDEIGDLQYERLSQAHDFYMVQKWCPDSKKHMLCNMYTNYKNKGRNHLTEHFIQDIMNLDDKPE